MDSKKKPEIKRESLRQKELKNNPTGSLNEGLKRAENDNLVDFAGSSGWKSTAFTILILIIGYIIYNLIFK